MIGKETYSQRNFLETAVHARMKNPFGFGLVSWEPRVAQIWRFYFFFGWFCDIFTFVMVILLCHVQKKFIPV